MFDLTLSMTTPQTPSPYLSMLMRSTRVTFSPPPPSTTSIPHQMINPFLPFQLLTFPVDVPSTLQSLVLAPAVHLPTLPPHAVLILRTCAGIIKITATRLRSVDLLLPGRETRKSKFFLLQIGSKSDLVSVDQLKPVFLDDPIQAASPPA